MDYIKIIIIAIIVNNIILSQFLGICSFLGVTGKVSTAIGMGAAVTFVIAMGNAITYLIQTFILVPYHIEFLQTITFIFVVAFLVQIVEIIVKKSMPPLYQALGIYLPLITTNCATLAVALLAVQKSFTLVESVIFASATGVGYTLALVLMAGIREQMEINGYPKGMKGFPMTLVIGSLLALAFMGFSGLVK
ncbi:MAG: RnfABCDGE type electron transport complex subunit A [Bacteroidetes bacterium]|nr:RnfABCDGE type electron transport complex subunit A [Bacteroidota bacterium]